MEHSKRIAVKALVLMIVMLVSLMPAVAKTRGKEAKYIGGTLSGVEDGTKGRFYTGADSSAEFLSKKGETLFTIPYDKITGLEYGQKAGRRLGLAIAVSPLFLFSKKRKHFMTVYFSDEKDANQAAVFEFGKGDIYPFGVLLEDRSGQKIDFESDEARKHFEKGAKK